MASVTVLLKGSPEAAARAAGDRHLRMFTRQAGLLRLPLIPGSLAVTDAADVWEEVDRPGRAPLLIRTGAALRKETFAAELWDHGRAVDGLQNTLRALAASKDPVVLTLADDRRGVYRITGLAFTDSGADLTPGGKPTRSVADIELTEDSDASPVVGPVPRGKGTHMARRT